MKAGSCPAQQRSGANSSTNLAKVVRLRRGPTQPCTNFARQRCGSTRANRLAQHSPLLLALALAEAGAAAIQACRSKQLHQQAVGAQRRRRPTLARRLGRRRRYRRRGGRRCRRRAVLQPLRRRGRGGRRGRRTAASAPATAARREPAGAPHALPCSVARRRLCLRLVSPNRRLLRRRGCGRIIRLPHGAAAAAAATEARREAATTAASASRRHEAAVGVVGAALIVTARAPANGGRNKAGGAVSGQLTLPTRAAAAAAAAAATAAPMRALGAAFAFTPPRDAATSTFSMPGRCRTRRSDATAVLAATLRRLLRLQRRQLDRKARWKLAAAAAATTTVERTEV
eukprot:355138-Chlamydomonas_euryale.AAC.5